jgi:hypothetical protein
MPWCAQEKLLPHACAALWHARRCARYGRHNRGVNPQYRAKSKNTGCHTISPRSSLPSHTDAGAVEGHKQRASNMHFFAQEYSKALGRIITYQDIPVEPWRDELLKRGWPVHVVNHLAAMGDLHRAGRFDRMSDDVLTLTGRWPLSVQELLPPQSRPSPRSVAPACQKT